MCSSRPQPSPSPLDSGFRRHDVVFHRHDVVSSGMTIVALRRFNGMGFDSFEVGFFAGYLDASEC